jgi:triosephosphate isomerase
MGDKKTADGGVKNKRTPLIVGNWKLNFDHMQAIYFLQKLSWELHDVRHKSSGAQPVILAPFTDLRSIQTLVDADKMSIKYGAQDVSIFEKGPYTGDISAEFLAKLDCSYCLCGHSERRTHYGETDETIIRKATNLMSHNITPIIPVGEQYEVKPEEFKLDTVLLQIETILAALPEKYLDSNTPVISYEPLWSVGTDKVVDPEQLNLIISGIRSHIETKFGSEISEKTAIIYGGSVNDKNAPQFLSIEELDGFLLGRASLDVEKFKRIIRIVDKIKNS